MAWMDGPCSHIYLLVGIVLQKYMHMHGPAISMVLSIHWTGTSSYSSRYPIAAINTGTMAIPALGVLEYTCASINTQYMVPEYSYTRVRPVFNSDMLSIPDGHIAGSMLHRCCNTVYPWVRTTLPVPVLCSCYCNIAI